VKIFPIKNSFRTFAFAATCAVAVFSGCELINPDEQVPAFLRMEGYSISTVSGQGHAVHNLTDAWVFHNEQLVGVYELPADIPLLSTGPTPLRIRAGMKVSGLVGQRSAHPFLNDVEVTLPFAPDSVTVLNPMLTYRSTANFRWVEDFEGSGISLTPTGVNQGTISRVEGVEAYHGQSLKITLAGNMQLAECASALAHPLPGQNSPVILEISYRNNTRFTVGLISFTASGVRQTTVMVINPSPEEWKHMYVNLTPTVSSSSLFGAPGHQVFFGFIHDAAGVEESYVLLDNIKLIH
jgi:hypothetical protein